MTQSFSRQQRRRMEREMVKANGKLAQLPNTQQPVQSNDYVTKKDLQLLVQDVQKVLNYAKLVDNHVWMLVETLDRKGLMNWSDVNDTEALYSLREKKKQEKIKNLLEQDLSLPEILESVKEKEDIPGYEKLDINPIKDLNVNPYELGVYLRDVNPDLSKEDYLSLGKSWGMTLEHFGFKKE